MINRAPVLLSAILTVVGAISCDLTNPSGGVVCTAEARPGIVVEIRAKADNRPLAYVAQAVAASGSYSESMGPSEFLTSDPQTMVSRQGAYERPGVYSVEVTAAGFQTVRFHDVLVLSGQCHVRTANLQALLEAVQ